MSANGSTMQTEFSETGRGPQLSLIKNAAVPTSTGSDSILQGHSKSTSRAQTHRSLMEPRRRTGGTSHGDRRD